MTRSSSILKPKIATRKTRTLLDLPNELIFDIITLALSTSHVSVPPSTTRRRLGEDFKKDRICYIDSDAAYEPNALALLLSSKALSAQTALYISKSPRLCEFDIAIVNAVYFFPTWRYIPTRNGLPSVMLEIVKVNLAPCCTEEVIAMVANWPTDVPPSGPKFSTPVGNASISSDLWEVQLFTVMTMFCYAAGYREWSEYAITDKDFKYPISARRLCINANTYTEDHGTLGEDIVPARKIADRNYSQRDALYRIEAAQTREMMEWLAFLMKKKLQSVHNGKNVKTMYFGVERVGRVDFSIDGNVIETVDVSEYANREDGEATGMLSQASGRRMRLWKTRRSWVCSSATFGKS
ncbi:hypothetical protein A1F94_002650 [Pyrenophora tritici-repentis]|nr:hypothetical protein A1F94_002650 [Pyrenophora tritici-repentis]